MRKISIIPGLLIIITFAARAQTQPGMKHDSLAQVTIKGKAPKLPNVQQISLRAPDKFKIDGKATEWAGQFQAYNTNDDIFYTLANDDKYLYLTLQATNYTIVNKILGGGVTFTINTSGKKNFKDGVSITYPMINKHDRIWVNSSAMPVIIPGNAASVMQADSFMNNNNLRLGDKSKLIMVTGIKGVDTLISLYNQDGIKAASQFDNKMAYTYELAIDLKKLGLTVNDAQKFTYNIKLGGVDMAAAWKDVGITVVFGEGGMPVSVNMDPGTTTVVKPNLPYKIHVVTFTSPTDFWGEYTLAKK